MKRTILKMSLISAMMLSWNSSLLAVDSVWHTVGTAGFGGTGFNQGAKGLTLALDGNSIPHVAFSDDGDYTKAFVMKYNGMSWAKLGSTLPAYLDTSSTSIAINSSGVPYVAYVAPDSSYENYWVRVAKYDGSIWQNVGGTGFGKGANTYLTIDSNGTPLVAYRDSDNEYDGTVKKFDGTNWTTVGSPGVISSPSIVTDSQNTPYVVSVYAASVKKFDGTSWVLVGSENFASGTVSDCSIAINSKGVPYVAFRDYDNGDKVTVMKYDGNSWVLVGSAGFSSTVTYGGTSIAIDDSDTPYVAYIDYDGFTQEAMVMRFDGSSWSVVGEGRFSTADVSNISLAINSEGVPYVSYRDGNIYNRATVMYAPSIMCAYKNQGDNTGVCIPGTPTPDLGDYPDILDRNYVQGNINEDGSRDADPGYQGDYLTLCRDGQEQGTYSCPR